MSVFWLAAVACGTDCIEPFAGMTNPIRTRQVIVLPENVFCINVWDCVFNQISMRGNDADGAIHVCDQRAEINMARTVFHKCDSERGAGVVFVGNSAHVESACFYEMNSTGDDGNAAYFFAPDNSLVNITYSSFSLCSETNSVFGTMCVAYAKLAATFINASDNKALRSTAFYVVTGRERARLGYFTIARNTGGTITTIIGEEGIPQNNIHDLVFVNNHADIALISGITVGNYTACFFVGNVFPAFVTGEASFHFIYCQFDCAQEDLKSDNVSFDGCQFNKAVVTPVHEYLLCGDKTEGNNAFKNNWGAFAAFICIILISALGLGLLMWYFRSRGGHQNVTTTGLTLTQGE